MDGKYQKLRPLGKGNMGVVQLVKRVSDGATLVMKLIDLSKMNKKERTASLNEAKVLSSLSHPNVINYVDSFLSRRTEHLCIVMEFAEGGDLSAKVKAQRGAFFTEDQILDWFIQICLAVDSCHRKRVMHRDIKTQNIFLTSEGVIKVGDFGISRVLMNTFDCAHTFVGTPYYLSPELVQEKPYNQMSDVWALGVVLYELMALRHPFNAMDMKGLMYKIMRVQYDPPPGHYSADLRSLIPRLLVKEPSKRLRVSQILDLPFVRARIAQWSTGAGHLPRSYVTALEQQQVFHQQSPERNGGAEPDPSHASDIESVRGSELPPVRYPTKPTQPPPTGGMPRGPTHDQRANAGRPVDYRPPAFGGVEPLADPMKRPFADPPAPPPQPQGPSQDALKRLEADREAQLRERLEKLRAQQAQAYGGGGGNYNYNAPTRNNGLQQPGLPPVRRPQPPPRYLPPAPTKYTGVPAAAYQPSNVGDYIGRLPPLGGPTRLPAPPVGRPWR